MMALVCFVMPSPSQIPPSIGCVFPHPSTSLGCILGVELLGRGAGTGATSLDICKLLTRTGLANTVLSDSEILPL